MIDPQDPQAYRQAILQWDELERSRSFDLRVDVDVETADHLRPRAKRPTRRHVPPVEALHVFYVGVEALDFDVLDAEEVLAIDAADLEDLGDVDVVELDGNLRLVDVEDRQPLPQLKVNR